MADLSWSSHSQSWAEPLLAGCWPEMDGWVAPTGDHVISLVDEISFTFPPSPPLSQIDDIPPEQFCNGDNRPADCGANCMCTHKVDIPYNAIVEVVLVDEVISIRIFHALTDQSGPDAGEGEDSRRLSEFYEL
ncbi:hypothetical protein QAD02_021294 [Eretmocerus hayati]|uniref:Uncharacterized protein n=1 Tax=Eretmocerus hayati TaxID=131215 RepID=A0ACC2PRA2_9HYME|nr:hypothetical protein QAD02_021294 [Eretmocerus hayati]